jgi:DNA uptake protein ComE-like DNA-binding protein
MKFVRAAAVALALAITAAVSPAAQVGKGLLDANTAAEKDLLGVPHMNAELVKAMIGKRPFGSQGEFNTFLSSQGLTPEQLKEVYGKTFVHLNLNTAPPDEIMMIPNMGKRMVHEFQEYRPYDGLARFRREIGKYVDEKEVARLEQYVFVPLDLNTASDQDILTIPGLGQRMLHEFKEYRPYKNMEQFRREIGKYVDKKEVARLERYVVIK